MNVTRAPRGPQPASTRHLFGIRAPGRLVLAVFRLPLHLYRRGWGRLLGHTFLLFVHAGRKTGTPHQSTAMVLKLDGTTKEAVIFSAWGPNSDWVRNLHVQPALQVQIGGVSFVPEQRFLSDDEAFKVVTDFRRHHPWRVRFATMVLGWDDLRSEGAVRAFVRARPFVAFRPSRTLQST